MSKAFKGKTCVYCGGTDMSSTEDHVFARQFFPEERRAGLPKVPAYLTIWRLKLYGGALLGGDPASSADASPRVWAMTSSRPAPELFAY